jgi:nitroreductase
MDRRDLYNAMWKRKSVRKYLEKHVEQSKVDRLRRSITALNEASGLNMEFIEDCGSFRSFLTMMFKNVRSVIVVKGRSDDPDLYEKGGYYGEQIVLEATAMDLGTCWVAMAPKGGLNIGEDESFVCAIPIGYGTDGMSQSTSVPDAPHRKTISATEFLKGNKDVPEWVAGAVKAVQFAPTARNSQKTRFNYSDGKVTAEISPGKLNMVDFGITKFHFELAADGKFPLGSPSVFVKK